MMAHPTRHFKTAFKEYTNFYLSYSKGDYEELAGLFNFVERGMQFSCDKILDESEVEQLPNGTWTGVVGRLNRSEIDYAPAPLRMTEERWGALAYNYPYACEELVFVTRKPEYSPEMMALFRTLSMNVWLSLMACLILVILVCFVVMKHRCTLQDILLHVLAIGLNQEGNLVPKRAGEILLLCTWLGAMAVFTFCFKSVLLSFLTFPPLGGVRTVPELAAAIRAGQYRAITYDGNDFASDLLRSSNENFRVIGQNMLKNPREDLTGFLNESSTYPIKAYVFMRNYFSFTEERFYVSKDNIGSFNLATAVRKDFCCKEEIDMLVHRFMAAGIDKKIGSFRDQMGKLYVHSSMLSWKLPYSETDRKLTMTDLSGAFLILVAGHCLSIFALIIECWIKRRKRRHSLKRKRKSRAV